LKEETAMSILTGQKVSVKLSGFRFQASGFGTHTSTEP